jgi:hypothetical protein
METCGGLTAHEREPEWHSLPRSVKGSEFKGVIEASFHSGFLPSDFPFHGRHQLVPSSAERFGHTGASLNQVGVFHRRLCIAYKGQWNANEIQTV